MTTTRGGSSRRRRDWTDDRALEALRGWLAGHQPPRYEDYHRDAKGRRGTLPSTYRLRTRWGRWAEILDAAGWPLTPDAGMSRGRRWRNRDILATVETWLDGRDSARLADYDRAAQANPTQLPPTGTVLRRFGSWAKVLEAADWNRPVSPTFRYWPKHAALDALRRWLAGRHSARVADYARDATSNRDLPSTVTLIARFGSWRDAVRAAGWTGATNHDRSPPTQRHPR